MRAGKRGKNGVGLIPPVHPKKARSCYIEKEALQAEVDDEKAMAEAIALNRADEELQKLADADALSLMNSPLTAMNSPVSLPLGGGGSPFNYLTDEVGPDRPAFYVAVPPRRPAFLATAGADTPVVEGLDQVRLVACQALPVWATYETVCTLYGSMTKKDQDAVAERIYHGHVAQPGKSPDLTHENLDTDADGKTIEWASMAAMFIGMAGRWGGALT